MFDQPKAEVGHRAVGSEDEVAEKADEFEDAVAGETVDFYMEQKKHDSELADKQKYPEVD